MIKNIHLLELHNEEDCDLFLKALLPQLQYKIQFTIVAADPVIVHILAIQHQTAMLTPAKTIHDVAIDLFTPFVKGRHLVVTALPYNKEADQSIIDAQSETQSKSIKLDMTTEEIPIVKQQWITNQHPDLVDEGPETVTITFSRSWTTGEGLEDLQKPTP